MATKMKTQESTNKIGQIQKQIRDSNQDLQEYVKELYEWEKEIKKKDLELKKAKPTVKQLPPVRGTTTKIQVEEESRSKRIPGSDFKQWDKFVSEIEKNEENEVSPQKPQIEEITDAQEEAIKRAKMSNQEKEKGNEFFKKGDYEKAITCYSRSIDLDPNNSLSFANRAQSYLNLSKYELAEKDCNAALLLDSKFVKAYLRRGTARMKLGSLKLALDDFQTLLKLEPGNKQALDSVSQIERSLNNKESKKQVAPVVVEEILPSSTEKVVAKPVVAEIAPHEVKKQENPKQNKEEKPKKQENPIESIQESKHSRIQDQSSPSKNSGVSPQPEQKIEEIKKTPISPRGVSSSSSLPVKTFEIKIDIPSDPPKTLYEFEYYWKSLNSDLGSLYKYIKNIPPESLPKLFKDSLNADILTGILNLIDQQFIPMSDKKGAFNVLNHLTRSGRFDMNIMFLSKKEKEVIAKILEAIGTSDEVSSEELKVIKAKYGIK